MKFCQSHWDALKAEIEKKGMGFLIPKTGVEAISKLKKEQSGELTIIDPLMSCHNMIVANALQNGGLYLMGQDEKGNQYCPLCEVKKNLGENADKEWIDGSTSGCLEHCRENGLLNNN